MQASENPKPADRNPAPAPVCTHTIRIPDWLYTETLDRLCEAIDGRDYFSSTIDFRTGCLDCCLKTAVIVYREQTSYPEGTVDEICDLVPIWWEFHTLKDGEEVLNDFQFFEMKKYL